MSVLRRSIALSAVALAGTAAGWCAVPADAGRPGPVPPEVAVQWRDTPFRATQVIVRRGPAGLVETRGRIARNSAGSTYVELIDASTQEPVEALIFDVSRHRELVLDLRRKRYRVLAMSAVAGQPATADSVADEIRVAKAEKDSEVHRVSDGVDSTWKGLGVRLVAGLETVGSVQVRRPAASPGESSDGPSEVDERWISVDLGIAVLRVKHDPIRGEDTEMMLTEVMRSEPDAALFAVPQGFVLDAGRPGARAVEAP